MALELKIKRAKNVEMVCCNFYPLKTSFDNFVESYLLLHPGFDLLIFIFEECISYIERGSYLVGCKCIPYIVGGFLLTYLIYDIGCKVEIVLAGLTCVQSVYRVNAFVIISLFPQ